MKAVILAAGEGKRLRPFTETMPKVMLPVANKPIIEYIVDALKKSGITEIVIVVGYKKEVIMEYFKDYNDIKIDYVEQDKQLGTAHALLQAKNKIKNSKLLVLSGDNIIDSESINKLLKDKSDYSLLIKEHTNPSKYGVVNLEKNQLKKIIEKPRDGNSRFISTGIYKLPKTVFKKIEQLTFEGEMDLTSVLQSLILDGKKISTVKADLWRDIVYPWDILEINETLIQKTSGFTSGKIEKGVITRGSVRIGKDTTIYSGSYIVGPVIIGKGCEIGPNVCIFPTSVIGDNTVIRPFTEIRNSTIMENSHIGSNSFISHSVIGRSSIIKNSFSSIVGNANVETESEIKKLEQIGVILGGDTIIESHVVTKPGLIIGRKCKINAMKNVIENIPSNSKVM